MVCVDLDRASLSSHEHYTRRQKKLGAMDPNQKLLLDEIDKRIAARFDGLERRLDASADSSSSRLDALEALPARSMSGAPASMASSTTYAWRSSASPP